MMGRLEDQVQRHDEYRRAYIAYLDWLANTRHLLQKLSDYSVDRKILPDRLNQLQVVDGSFNTIRVRILCPKIESCIWFYLVCFFVSFAITFEP